MEIMNGRSVEPDEASATYSTRLVDDYFDLRGDIGSEVTAHLDRVEPVMERYKRSVTMGSFAIEQVGARAFYETMVRPYVLKGALCSATKEKTFAPDQAYIDDLISQICDGGVTSQMYIRLLQSRPGETPTDSRIGYGTLELLRTWAIRTKVAKELGLNYAVSIVDETEAFDHGDLLGFTPEAIKDSYLAMQYFIHRSGLSDADVRITPFSHQSNLYRDSTSHETDLAIEYSRLLDGNIEKTLEDLRLATFSLNAIRAVMIHRLRHGDSFTNVSSNQDLDYLANFHPDDVGVTVRVSESFNSALQMRSAVKRHIGRAGLQQLFPEFYGNTPLLHWGITKKADRLAIQPNFKVYKGRLVTPGYALPIYEEGTNQFMGLTNYSERANDEFSVIYGPNDLPTALVKRE